MEDSAFALRVLRRVELDFSLRYSASFCEGSSFHARRQRLGVLLTWSVQDLRSIAKADIVP